MEDYKFYNMVQILDFLGIKYDFENNEGKQYPFKDKPSDIIFNYGYITIPREGIEKIIQNKISDKDYNGIIEEIKMHPEKYYMKKEEDLSKVKERILNAKHLTDEQKAQIIKILDSFKEVVENKAKHFR